MVTKPKFVKSFNTKDRDFIHVKGITKIKKYIEDCIMKLSELLEEQSLGGALKNALSKAEPGSKLDRSIKNHIC